MRRPISSRKARSARLAIISGAALLAYVGLGLLVSPRPPSGFDLAAAGMVGVATPFALFATRSGLFPVYLTVSVIAVVFAAMRREWVGRVAFAVAALLLTWKISDLFKWVFHRARPERWVAIQETSYGYSSGHAALSLVVYGLWAFLIWRTALPLWVRATVATVVGLWIVAIDWSRLALGAHYPTDILGGILLAVAVLAGLQAAVDLFSDVQLSSRPRVA